MSYGVGRRQGSDLALLWLRHRQAAPIRPLAWELPYAAGMALKSQKKKKDVCTPIFITPLFTIAKVWKQPKCPLTDELIKKMWCLHNNGILLSHKKE